MTVKNLIKELGQYDENREIIVVDEDNNTLEITNVYLDSEDIKDEYVFLKGE